ncbi:MAG: tetratricopeptide repeat protein, partial [Gammaproteobacteria bacterium]
SMGWVLYRLGQPEDALRYLQDAFARFPDPEVAAHLGEVLWVLGRREEALTAWKKGLEAKADSPLVLEAMRRLGAPLPGGKP